MYGTNAQLSDKDLWGTSTQTSLPPETPSLHAVAHRAQLLQKPRALFSTSLDMRDSNVLFELHVNAL